MTRLILALLVLATSILPLCAQSSSLHTDRSGYTTGFDGNRTVNTYTDRYGNTTGLIAPYRSGRSPDWLKMKNSAAPAVKREAEEDWGQRAVAMTSKNRIMIFGPNLTESESRG
jgi:hypothetical protein